MQVVTEVHGVRSRGGLHLPAAKLWLQVPAARQGLQGPAARLGLQGPAARQGPQGPAVRGVAFLGRWDGRPVRAARILCSTVVASLAGTRKALAVPLGRTFQMGRMAVQLLPAGSGPGAAMLRVHLDGRRLLYLAQARPDPLPAAEAPQFEEADIAIVDASHAAGPVSDLAQFRTWVETAVAQVTAGGALGLVLDEPALALDVLAIVGTRVPVRLGARCKRWLGRVQAAGLPVVLRQPGRGGGAVLWLGEPGDDFPAVERWRIGPGAWPPDTAQLGEGISQALSFGTLASGEQIDAMVLACGAREVLALGAGAQALADRLEPRGLQVWHLEPQEQLPLV